MAMFRKTAAELFSKIEKPEEVSANNVTALAEVVSYANEGEYAALFKKCLAGYRATANKQEGELKAVNKALDVLRRCGIDVGAPVR